MVSDPEELKRRLMDHLRQMDATELSIKSQSQRDLLDYLQDIATEIAGAFAYIVGTITGFIMGLVDSIGAAIEDSYTRAHNRRRYRER